MRTNARIRAAAFRPGALEEWLERALAALSLLLLVSTLFSFAHAGQTQDVWPADDGYSLDVVSPSASSVPLAASGLDLLLRQESRSRNIDSRTGHPDRTTTYNGSDDGWIDHHAVGLLPTELPPAQPFSERLPYHATAPPSLA